MWAILGLCAATIGRGQDAATEERLNQLGGKIEDLGARLERQRQDNEILRREIASLQDQLNKPVPTYATLEYVKSLGDYVKTLAEAIEKVDRSRLQDNKETRATVDARVKELIYKIDALAAIPPPVAPVIRRTPPPSVDSVPVKPVPEETGFWYKIDRDDTLSAIVQACRERNIKVTRDQILKANPKLKPEVMVPGNKIWIPVAKP